MKGSLPVIPGILVILVSLCYSCPMELTTEIEFTRAKAALSEVMTEVVHRQHPKVIDRNGGRERALLIGGEVAEAALAGYRFAPEVILDEGEVTVRLSEFGLLGFGETVDEAISDLVAELDAYAERFLGDYAFYRRTNRAQHLPYLLRFKITPPERRPALLLEDSRAQATAE
ncbi:hypothetical protein B1A_02391 [mine drainage metagenome]|uniref:Uncharacterized protein n=1 Tax=mine drainage metagenome TaxID=410659 RepID=T1D9P3_9ZZZZ